MSVREKISELLWTQPKLLAKSNAETVQVVLVCGFAAKNVWELVLICKNLWCISDFSHLPPPEYEIPPGGPEMTMWKNEARLALKQCEYHLFVDAFEFAMNSSKIYFGYYPKIWVRTGRLATDKLPRAFLFVALDHAVTNVGRFFIKLFAGIFLAVRHDSTQSVQEEMDSMTRPREDKVESINDFKDLLTAVFIEEVFSVAGIAWIVLLNHLLDALFLRKFEFETDSYKQISKFDLPGCNEIIALANQMGFFKRDLILEVREDAPPRATHHNFILSDIIVISRSLLTKLPPSQSKSIVGHEMIHWKAGYAYWDHIGGAVYLCSKLYLCSIAQDLPSLFNFEDDVHPAVILAVLYNLVFPAMDDIAYGVAGWIHTLQAFRCDRSIDEAASSLVYLKQALVRLAVHRGPQKFDGWYSSWYFGEPSLISRITRIRRRAS